MGSQKKTKKYRLEVTAYDTIQTSTAISEATYKKMLKDLQAQVAKTKDTGCEFEVEEKSTVTDYSLYTETSYRVTVCMTDIELVALVCKPGYCFT